MYADEAYRGFLGGQGFIGIVWVQILLDFALRRSGCGILWHNLDTKILAHFRILL